VTRQTTGRFQGALFSADGWAVFLAATAARLYLGVLLSFAVIAVLPALAGWQASVVRSGSMEPHISTGDVVVVAGFGNDDPVPVGGVVRFASPAEAEPDGQAKARLHRVVGVNTDGTFITAGDANADVDSMPLRRDQIIGQPGLLVPSIGLPGLWLDTGNLAALALWASPTLAAVVAAIYGPRPVGAAATAAAVQPPGGKGSAMAGASGGRRTYFMRWLKQASWRNPGPQLKTIATITLTIALCALVVLGAAGFTSAGFTATTANEGTSFSTSVDWAPPTVSLASPGTPVKDTLTLTATATDAETGIHDVAIQYLPSGDSSWTTLCTATSAPPYSCAWNTKTVIDGSYSLRAIATDNASHSTTSTSVDTAVANNLLVVLTDPGEIQRGTVNLAAILYNSGTSSYTVRVEYSVAGADNWKTLCPAPTFPYNCSWNTATIANGYYDLRAIAVSGATTTVSAPVTDILVDNLAPTVSMTDPGSPLGGTRTFAATAADADSGVAQATLQYSRSGTGPWTTFCTLTTSPYSCRFDTTALADGTYNLRAIATDAAGLSTTSTAVTNRVIDNTISSISLENPGDYLTGAIALNASVNSTGGVSSVKIQSAPAGTTTWTTLCSITAPPYNCTWDTRTATDGLYDLRAVLTDGATRETISTTVASRRVDNSPLRGIDVQTANGSAIAGKLDAGDTMTFTYSQQVNPATVSPGWNGTAMAVTLRLRDGNLLNLGNNSDTVDIQRTGSTVNLGSVNLNQNYAKPRKTAIFDATMTAATATINGVPSTLITVTLGTSSSGATSLATVSAPSIMVWSPAASVTNLSGTPSSTAPVNERAPLDREF
jgi:signal peptidase I